MCVNVVIDTCWVVVAALGLKYYIGLHVCLCTLSLRNIYVNSMGLTLACLNDDSKLIGQHNSYILLYQGKLKLSDAGLC